MAWYWFAVCLVRFEFNTFYRFVFPSLWETGLLFEIRYYSMQENSMNFHGEQYHYSSTKSASVQAFFPLRLLFKWLVVGIQTAIYRRLLLGRHYHPPHIMITDWSSSPHYHPPCILHYHHPLTYTYIGQKYCCGKSTLNKNLQPPKVMPPGGYNQIRSSSI